MIHCLFQIISTTTILIIYSSIHFSWKRIFYKSR